MIKEPLRRLLQAENLTPEALAFRMQSSGTQVTAGAIRGWLSGDRTPNLANARALAAALNCSLDSLFVDAPEKAAV